MTGSVTVVGVGADGWAGLAGPARTELLGAGVVLGAERHLALLPADVGGRRVAWPSPMMPALPGLLASFRDERLAVLASGDPMFFGVGTAVAGQVDPSRLHVVPHPSSTSLACARLGWSVPDVEVLSAVARPVATVRAALAPGRRLLVLSEDAATPAAVAAALTDAGYGEATLTVLSRLGAADEARVDGVAATWAHPPGAALNVVAVTCPDRPDDALLGRAPGLPDDAYDHDGQLSKAEVRALTVAALRPLPGQLLWDVGGGAGSVGIEWMRHHPSCRAVSVEVRPDRAERITGNAARLGVPGLRVVTGRAPAALAGLPAPDAVFVGGGVTGDGMLATCWDALRPGGRLVANAVTVEGESALAAARAAYGGNLRRLSVDRAEPVGRFTGWRPLAPVTQWTVGKGSS